MDIDGIGGLFDGIGELLGAIFGSTRRDGTVKKCKHCGKIAFLVIVGIVAGVIYMQPQWSTENTVKAQAVQLCHHADTFSEKVDGWDREMKFSTEEVKEPYATNCMVTSSGRDGEFGTSDDVVGKDTNIHVAKNVGKWSVEKLKDFASGASGAWE